MAETESLARIYSYLTSNEQQIDSKFLEEVLRTTGHQNPIKNTTDLLEYAYLKQGRNFPQINFYPLIKICLKEDDQQLEPSEFQKLYQTLVKIGVGHFEIQSDLFEYRTMILIHEYLKKHPELQTDNLLLSPFRSNSGRPWINLDWAPPEGRVKYLLKSKLKSTVFNSQAMQDIEENEVMVRLINILTEYDQVVIAGGYPTAMLDHTLEYNPQSDVDIFIYGSNRKNTAQAIIQEINKEFGPTYHKRVGSVVTFWIPDSPIKIQIILSRTKNLFQLLFNYDFNYCSWAYLPRRDEFVGILESFYSLKTRTTFLNSITLKLKRLIKAHYKGYHIVAYQPFEIVGANPDQIAEIFQPTGINLKELTSLLPEEEYHFDYYVPLSSLPVKKNLYDLRKYYGDSEIKSGPVDLTKINYWGIGVRSDYKDDNKDVSESESESEESERPKKMSRSQVEQLLSKRSKRKTKRSC